MERNDDMIQYLLDHCTWKRLVTKKNPEESCLKQHKLKHYFKEVEFNRQIGGKCNQGKKDYIYP